MTAENWPNPLKLEVKSSRTTQHNLSARDLSGITPDGFAAVLITERFQHGPRWVFVPGNLLQPGNHTDAELSPLAATSLTALSLDLNLFWSNWILDESMWAKLFEQEHMKLMPALEWCLRQHQPRLNRSAGNLRESKLNVSLQHFRSKLDTFVDAENGPQQEGFIHQKLLAHALTGIGYQLSENPVGIPDICAVRSIASRVGVEGLRERLSQWQPQNPELTTLRNNLLSISNADLQELCDIIGPGHLK